MSMINVISAIGNNDSICPLFIRDCLCENPIKCALTYKQNSQDKFIAKNALREKVIDEYGASAVWLGGIPLISFICDKFINIVGFNSKVSPKLFNDDGVQGLKTNIDKFKTKAPQAIKDLEKISEKKRIFQNAQIVKLFATTVIPIALMGFILPKINFSITKNKVKNTKNNDTKTNNVPSFTSFAKNARNISFKGANNLVNMTNIQKMMITDVGLGYGRTKTERTTPARLEKAFGAIGAFILNYVTPKVFDNGFKKLSKKLFNIDTQLDVKILSNPDFVEKIKNNSLNMPNDLSPKGLLNFIDNNPKSFFNKIAQEQKIVSVLKNGIRDPRSYVETDNLKELVLNMQEFAKGALKSNNVEQFAKKALSAKCFTTVSNILLSSFLLSFVLPKLQFIFRELITGSKLDSGIESYRKA